VYTGDRSCFFTFPEEAENHITLGGFRDVLGYDGVVISYPDRLPERSEIVTVSDYYIFDDGFFSGGGPALLARPTAMSPTLIWTATGRRSCAPSPVPRPRCSSAGAAGCTRRT
jgi:hypothetical protein